ncbi:RNA polymerase sigma factor [Maribacter algarum]|uniref:RNA polymerase sigma factor n=1 Tax=Maribacter algarum (ex Zhang et al. 2020) TaxID=2578118 RepID=A0A5S3PVG4_9FLAO|nr:RNA polymerase sigma factor [Maribacter algarum]TMM56958.1 RNA polymerase sigma factor [Maribacter algarum]
MRQDQSTDKKLVKKVLEGNSNAFKTIVVNTQGLVVQIIYKMIKNQEDREDLAQEVFLKAYDKLGSFKFNSKLSTWIGTITYNTCLNFLEKKKILILNIDEDGLESWDLIDRKVLGNSNSQVDSHILRKEKHQIIASEIENLPPLYKTLISLYHNQELSYKEIGEITSLPEGTLKNYLYRARKQLKNNLLGKYKREDL